MDNIGYEINGLSLFENNPVNQAIQDNPSLVKTSGNQTIGGDKIFTGTVTLENEVIHNSTSFSTEDGIIEQLKGNTGDMLDYGNYGVYNDGISTKYKGIINKKQTDKFYVFHNQINQPTTSLNLGTQGLGSLVVRDPVEDDEVATKRYVESHGGGSYLPLNGGILTGDFGFTAQQRKLLLAGKTSTNSTPEGNFITTISNNDLVIYKGLKFLALNNNEIYTNQRLNMNNNDIINIKNLDFDDTGLYNVLRFPAANRLSIVEGTDNPFMHFNSLASNQLIELMKNINIHGNINMISNDINNCDSITANRLNITTNTGIINFGDNTVNNILGGNSYTQIAGGNGKYFVCNQLTNETNNNINMTGQNILNCESITCQGSVLTLSAGGAGAFRITNTLSDSLVPIRMNLNKITNLGAPTTDNDATNKKYVDDAVNGGGEVHLPKYHTVFTAPDPDSGETYKTYTNDGFTGQGLFYMSSPILSTSSGYALWNINIPPLFFQDELVGFFIKITEDGVIVETIESGATYNGSVNSGYLTIPAITKGCHEFQTANASVILGVQVYVKPRGAINSTAKLDLGGTSSMNKMYRVFDVELININT